jgi:hypothetical protein
VCERVCVNCVQETGLLSKNFVVLLGNILFFF